ncbi:zinc finger and SCAN domain-containing protein 2-like isoform X1 [Artemia franciscana]|uniref:zinc finger and SCAN domain-containing protein 2-like isoform X1 n=2 Tax=Artemia franciscana TaxID=6661 RepID=UPI0032DB0EFA
MRIRSKESYIFKTRSHQEAKIHQTTKKSNFIINWIVEIMDTIELPLHATIKQEVEDTFPIENDPVFGSTNLVLSPKQEDDSLMNSHHKYTEFEPDSNSPDLALAAVKDKEIEDVYQNENPSGFEASFAVLSQMEEDPLAVSTSISVKLESNFDRPQFDLTVSSNEDCQASLAFFNNECLEALSSSINAKLEKGSVYRPNGGDNSDLRNTSYQKSIYFLPSCNKKRVSSVNISNAVKHHKLGKHQKSYLGEKMYKSEARSVKFPRPSGLNSHPSRHGREKPYECETCNKYFSKPAYLKYHQRIHTGDKPYKCDICNKNFNQTANLKRHIRIHTGEKPYKCDICNASFTQAANLNNHQRIHSGDKPYKCNVCNRDFAFASNLRYHERIHTGDKPHKCNICNINFAHAPSLKYHQGKHTSDRPYKCDTCNENFNQAAHLKRHRKIHAGE